MCGMKKRKTIQKPPRRITLADSHVVCYAVLDETVGYTSGHGLFFVDGEEIGRVPCLAICQDKDTPRFTLYFCNSAWNMLGVAADYQSTDAAKHRAERIYPGSSSCWTDAN